MADVFIKMIFEHNIHHSNTIFKLCAAGLRKDDVDILLNESNILLLLKTTFITADTLNATIFKPRAAGLREDADVGFDSQLWEIVCNVPAECKVMKDAAGKVHVRDFIFKRL